jgi:hypothetical protein
MSANNEREQARQRQARKRQRDREARLNQKTITTIGAEMPPAWRDEWLYRIGDKPAGNRSLIARKARASAEIEKCLPLIPEYARAKFIADNRRHTKISVSKLRERLIKERNELDELDEEEWQQRLEDDEWCPVDRSTLSVDGVVLGSSSADQLVGQLNNLFMILREEVGRREVDFTWHLDARTGSASATIGMATIRALRRGSLWWWIIAVSGDGGLGDRRVSSCCKPRPLNPPAMAFQRAARLHSTACISHSASVTARPEYWSVLTVKNVFKNIFLSRNKRLAFRRTTKRDGFCPRVTIG